VTAPDDETLRRMASGEAPLSDEATHVAWCAAEVLRLRAERDVMEADLAAVRRIMGGASDRALRAEDAERLCAAALAHARGEAAYHRQAADALRAVIEGRTTPPTAAECAALAAAGGAWLVRWPWRNGVWDAEVAGRAVRDVWMPGAVCVALDAQRRPCPWPEVAQ
jgi:hypothetical protein